MVNKIRVGIVGYGNLGRGVESAIRQNGDMELAGIFTRRSPSDVKSFSKVYSMEQIGDFGGRVDVMVMCGGSAKDLPEQVVEVARMFNTVDSFDTHAKIPEYFARVDEVAKAGNTLSLISTGWDPGLFSLARLLGESVLPEGKEYTFWGKGLSQGHSDAVRRVDGVKNGVQYTIPAESCLERIRSGETPDFTTAQKHQRVCYVVAEEGADKSDIELKIKTMPHYFEPYPTTVHFISEDELKRSHSGMPHGGIVFRSGLTGEGNNQRIEFSLNLDSNPEFTASVLVACARAVVKMGREGKTGAISLFDIPIGYLSDKSPEELRKRLL